MEDMKTEQLQPGQGLAGLGEGATSQLGASHEQNSEFGEARDLGPGDVEQMFGPAKTPLEGLRAAGNVEENPAEMGGGGEPIDDWVVKKGGYDNLLKLIQQNGWGDSLVWKLDDGTKLSVAEVKRRATAAPTHLPSEPQPAPKPVDWKASLPPDQRQRLQAFETKIASFDAAQLQMLSNRLKELQTLALTDGWQSKEIKEVDVDMCLRMTQEKLVGQDSLESMLIENSLFDHFKLVQQREGLKNLQDTLLYLAGKLGYHDSLLENPSPDLFPPASRLPNGEWDTTGDKLIQFLRKLTTGNKLNNGG